MKAISLWARNHRVQAISYLILLETILLGFYFFAGIYLFAFDVVFPWEISYIGVALFIIACLLHPLKGVTKGWFKYSYQKTKSVQGLVLLSTIILMCNLGNQLSRSSMMIAADVMYEVKPVVLGPKKINKKPSKISRKQRRINRKVLKKKLRSFIKNIRASQKVTGGDVFLIIIFGAAFTFLLGYLVAAIYCNLACSGRVALANTVLVFGGILWVLGLIGLIRWISGNRERKEATKLKTEEKKKEG